MVKRKRNRSREIRQREQEQTKCAKYDRVKSRMFKAAVVLVRQKQTVHTTVH